MKIKICGITTLEDARFCAAAGADYLGFIQYEHSPRYLSAGDARAIIEWLYGPQPVGVFVDTRPDAVNAAADRAGFALVQLQGDETPEDCAAVERPVIKAIGIRPETTAEDVRRAVDRYDGAADYLLLDTRAGSLRGGTGKPFDWRLAAALGSGTPLFLAGGLRPENVAGAVSLVRPFGVDVASGVEEAPGRKDFVRVQAFIDALAPFRNPTG
jgi:phosphoribosylanthranilate isomerase